MSNQKGSSRAEAGQTSILIIVLLLIAGVFFMQGVRSQVQKEEGNSCYINPDASRAVYYKGTQYDLIRTHSALSTEQFGWHMKELEKVQYAGQTKLALRASTWAESSRREGTEGKNPNDIAGFPQEARDLLFLQDVDVSKAPPGYVFVDIFLKHGIAIPDFIRQFCEPTAGQPVDAIKIFPNPDGTRFPPAHLGKNDPGMVANGSTTEYTLFAYERQDSAAGKVHSGGQRVGAVTINGKSYSFNFVSYAGYLALYDDASGLIYLYSGCSSKNCSIPIPSGPPQSEVKKTLQLNTFEVSTLYPWGWWSPECKPAVYLYPKETTKVHVGVAPRGYLTYTDPQYPYGGWDVTAQPSGQLQAYGKQYDYLYYESKIEDSAIEKPSDGFVVSYDELPKLYSEILPKLGLNEKETKDFKDYWEKALTEAPYYFVGIMENAAIEKIEPLTVSPKPTTMIRVRLFFQALDKKIDVKAPTIITPKRDGFTVVEWGGLVKNDANHPFTCSQ